MSAATEAWIGYEQPLSERVRTMLRLEHLFRRARHALEDDDTWASRTVVESLIDIISVLGRSDLKKEVIKELERHAVTLEALARNPNVDPARLSSVQAQVNNQLMQLRANDRGFGQALRGNELFNVVKQRSAIPAGTCDFDLPGYHFWLKRPASQRQAQLEQWVSAFDDLRESIALCIRLVRDSGVSSREHAPGGMFQKSLEPNTPCQMVRVLLPAEALCFPEISAGRHRFTVRFMQQDSPLERPVQVTEDVDFRLVCCII
jgi:cell division protein ZapD